MIPIRDKMACGNIVLRKQDMYGNLVWRTNNNPILDTHQYKVKFSDEEFTELTKNVMAEAMYYQCNKDGNYYVLLDLFVDWKNDEKALSLKYQKVVYNVKPNLKCGTSWRNIQCQRKDGYSMWDKLYNLKE